MAQVFVSYSHQDGRAVERIVEGLKAEGYSLWWDKALRSPDDFGVSIEARLAEARCVVVVWSSSARDSLWVRAEANEALEQHKLVQVAAERTKPPLPFTMLHMLDLSRWRGDRNTQDWQALPVSINAVITGVSRDTGSFHQTTRPGAFLTPMIVVGIGSIALIALTAILTVALVRSSSITLDFISTGSWLAFAVSWLGLGYALSRVIDIGLASRRRT